MPLVWFFYKSFKNFRNNKRQILLVWILLPFIFFSVVKTKMQAYTLFTATAIFIVTGLFWHYLFQLKNKFHLRWVVVIIVFLLIALPVRYTIERISPFTKEERNPQWTKELRYLKNKLEPYRKTVIFNAEYPIETMFYSDCIAYRNIPDSITLSNIKQEGYNIFIRKKNNNKTNKKNCVIILNKYNIVYSAW